MQKRFMVLLMAVFVSILCGCNEKKPELSVKFTNPPYDDFSRMLGIRKFDFEIEFSGKADIGLICMDIYKRGVKVADKMDFAGCNEFPKPREGFNLKVSVCILDSKHSAVKPNTQKDFESDDFFRMVSNSTFDDNTIFSSGDHSFPYDSFRWELFTRYTVFHDFDLSSEYIPFFYITNKEWGQRRALLSVKNGKMEISPDHDFIILYLKTQSKNKSVSKNEHKIDDDSKARIIDGVEKNIEKEKKLR